MQLRYSILLTSVTTVLLSACGSWEHATVMIEYRQPFPENALEIGEPVRDRVENAFKQFTERNGYKCRPHIKRVEEITCRGPKDLHLKFEPTVNKSEFVATFSWVDTSDRTHVEFLRHVAEFREAISSAVKDANVHLAGDA